MILLSQISTIGYIALIKLILSVVRFCTTFISFLGHIPWDNLIRCKQKICLFKIFKEVMCYSFGNSRSTIVWCLNLIRILIACRRLIIISHWCIQVTFLSICCLWSASSSTDLWFTDIVVSLLGCALKVGVCTLNIFSNRGSCLDLLRRISATSSFHIVKALCLF